jgi:hypothetical protein
LKGLVGLGKQFLSNQQAFELGMIIAWENLAGFLN